MSMSIQQLEESLPTHFSRTDFSDSAHSFLVSTAATGQLAPVQCICRYFRLTYQHLAQHNFDLLQTACLTGSVPLVHWICEHFWLADPPSRELFLAIEQCLNGCPLPVARYLMQRFQPLDRHIVPVVAQLLEAGDVDIVMSLLSQPNAQELLPLVPALLRALVARGDAGSFHTVLDKFHVTSAVLCELLITAVESKHHSIADRIVQQFQQQGEGLHDLLRRFCERGHIDVLKWMQGRGLLSAQDMTSIPGHTLWAAAVMGNQCAVIQWLQQHYPLRTFQPVAELLQMYGCRPSPELQTLVDSLFLEVYEL
jgi:hypothetical protein